MNQRERRPERREEKLTEGQEGGDVERTRVEQPGLGLDSLNAFDRNENGRRRPVLYNFAPFFVTKYTILNKYLNPRTWFKFTVDF